MVVTNDKIREALSSTVGKYGSLVITGSRTDHDWDLPEYWLNSEVDRIRHTVECLHSLNSASWQEADEGSVRKGDRVKLVRQLSDGTTVTIEGVADQFLSEMWTQYWVTAGGYPLTGSASLSGEIATLYRIPRPVDPPNPDVDKLILENGRLYQAGSDGVYRSLTEAGNLITSMPEAFDDWDRVVVTLKDNQED